MNFPKTCTARAAFVALWATLVGCSSSDAQHCLSMDDCVAGHICRLQTCVQINDAPTARPALLTQPPPDASQDSNWDAPADSTSLTPTCQGVRPSPGSLIIHEALMSVPQGLEGDANADGERDAYDDEFVELLNLSGETIDLFGVALGTSDRARHTFSQRCLAPGEGLVLFSGPRGRPAALRDGVWHLTSATRLSMTNTQGTLWLKDAHDRVLSELHYNNPRAMSYTRSTQAEASGFVPHADLTGTLFSPGTCADGSPLIQGCPQAPAIAEDMGGDLHSD